MSKHTRIRTKDRGEPSGRHVHDMAAPAPRTLSRRSEMGIVILLCIVAGVRVFLIAALFPYFSNVDEAAHFDVVLKYARGHVPGELEYGEPGSARLAIVYGSGEFTRSAPSAQGGRLGGAAPAGERPSEAQIEQLVSQAAAHSINHESTQPPVYYAAAALWYRLGRGLGLPVQAMVHWVRFLGIPIYMLLVWLAYIFAANIYPGRPFLRMGAPLLVAFFPQTIFAFVNNDVPSALLAGAALYCLLRIYPGGVRSYWFYALAGLLCAAAFLDKFTNYAVLVALMVIVVGWIGRSFREGEARQSIQGAAVLLVAAGLPVVLWLARNVLVVGDLTGSADKVRHLTWTLKPLGSVFDHAIFSYKGMVYFISNVMAQFWRGELMWHGSRQHWPRLDSLNIVSSCVLPLVSVIWAWTARNREALRERIADYVNLAVFALSVFLLVVISVVYDFGTCVYPSRAIPFLVSGRLILGALIPFSMLYLSGFDRILTAMRISRLRFWILGLVLFSGVLWQAYLLLQVIGNQQNWFHMI